MLRYVDASWTDQKRDKSFVSYTVTPSCKSCDRISQNSVRKSCLPKSSVVVSKKENCQQTNVVDVDI